MNEVIIGTGIDIVKVERVQKAIDAWGERFTSRIYTPEEQRYCLQRGSKYLHFASRFAAKEAVRKALGARWQVGVRWSSVEIVNDEAGHPRVTLHGGAKETAAALKVKQVLLSISHDGEYAVASAVLVGEI